MIPRNRQAVGVPSLLNTEDHARRLSLSDALESDNPFMRLNGVPASDLDYTLLKNSRSASSTSMAEAVAVASAAAAAASNTAENSTPRNSLADMNPPVNPYRQRRDSLAFFPVLEDYEQLKVADEQFDLKVSKAYILDAVKGRMPNLRIQRRDELPWWGCHLTPLRAYNLVHHRTWRRIISLVLFFHLSLTLWEYKYPNVGLGMEFLVTCVYLVDALLRTYSHDRDQDIGETWLPLTWARTRYIAIVLTFIDLFVSALVPEDRNAPYRLSRLLRPFFFIERGRVLRQLTMAVVYTIPKVMEVVVLIGINIVIFGIFGFYLFSEYGLRLGDNPNFIDIETSCWSLVVLMSTANFPDVMMASYSYSNWTAIFFILYLLIALYLLFQIILAAVFSRFQDRAKEMLSEIPKIQTVCLCAAFELLADASLIPEDSTDTMTEQQSPSVENTSSHADQLSVNIPNYSETDSQSSSDTSRGFDPTLTGSLNSRQGVLMTERTTTINSRAMPPKQPSSRALPGVATMVPGAAGTRGGTTTTSATATYGNGADTDALQKKRMWERFAGLGAEFDREQLERAGFAATDPKTRYLQSISALHPNWSGGLTAAVARQEATFQTGQTTVSGGSTQTHSAVPHATPLLGPTRARQGSVGILGDDATPKHTASYRIGSVPILPSLSTLPPPADSRASKPQQPVTQSDSTPPSENVTSQVSLGTSLRKTGPSGSLYKRLGDPSTPPSASALGELKDSYVEGADLERTAIARLRRDDGTPVAIVPGRWQELPSGSGRMPQQASQDESTGHEEDENEDSGDVADLRDSTLVSGTSGLSLAFRSRTASFGFPADRPVSFASFIRHGGLPDLASPLPSPSATPGVNVEKGSHTRHSSISSRVTPMFTNDRQGANVLANDSPPTMNPSGRQSPDTLNNFLGAIAPGLVSRKAFHRFLGFVRHDLEKDHIDIIFNAMDVSKSGFIELREWLRLIDFIDVSFRLQDDPEAYRAPDTWWDKARAFLKSPTYNTLCDLVVIFNCILVAIMLSSPNSAAYTGLSQISLVFTALFAAELGIRIIFIGPKEFFQSALNIFDVIIVSAAIILRITSALGWTPTLLREMDLFRVIRVIRVLALSKRARAILNTVGRLTPALRSLFMILLAFYYFFAVLGMGLFRGVIKRGEMSPEFMETYYAQNNYWENNFNDFTHALVLLFEIMIVNNWNLTVEAFVVATGTHWTRVYFVLYFFCTVIVGMNVVVALILEAFITKYSTADSEIDSENSDECEDLDCEYRTALTNALNEYAEARDVTDLPNRADNPTESQEAPVEGEQNRTDSTKLRRLWQVVLKRRTQRMYKLIFESKNTSEHIRGE